MNLQELKKLREDKAKERSSKVSSALTGYVDHKFKELEIKISELNNQVHKLMEQLATED